MVVQPIQNKLLTKSTKNHLKTPTKHLQPPTINTACTIEDVVNTSNTSFDELLQLLKESHQDKKRIEAEHTKLTAAHRNSRILTGKLQAEAKKIKAEKNKIKTENKALMKEVQEGALDTEKTLKANEEKEEYKAKMLEAVRRHNELEEENAYMRGEKMAAGAVTAKLEADLATEKGKNVGLNEEIYEKSKQTEKFKGLAKKYQKKVSEKVEKIDELESIIEQSSEESADEDGAENAVTAVCNECAMKKGTYAYCPTLRCEKNKDILAKTLARLNHECGRHRAALTYANKALREAGAGVQIKYDQVGAGFYAEAVFTGKVPRTTMKLTRYSKIESGQHKDNEPDFEFAIATCTGNPLNPNPSLPTREQVIENAENVMGKYRANKMAGSRGAHVGEQRVRVKSNFDATRKIINESRGDEEAECNKVVLRPPSGKLTNKKVSSDCRKTKKWEFKASSDCRLKK